MTHWNGEPMRRTYRRLAREEDLLSLYARLRGEDLLWAVKPEVEAREWTEEVFLQLFRRPDVWVLEGSIDGEPAGAMTLRPAEPRSLCGEIGLTAFRPFFRQAVPLCLGALLLACEELAVASFLGRVPAPNRHILAMLDRVGFHELGRVPGLCWHSRKQAFVDGVLVLATPESVRARARTDDK